MVSSNNRTNDYYNGNWTYLVERRRASDASYDYARTDDNYHGPNCYVNDDPSFADHNCNEDTAPFNVAAFLIYLDNRDRNFDNDNDNDNDNDK